MLKWKKKLIENVIYPFWALGIATGNLALGLLGDKDKISYECPKCGHKEEE